MAPQFTWLQLTVTHQPYIHQLASPEFNKSSERCSITPMPWTPPCLSHLVPSLLLNPKALKKLPRHLPISLTSYAAIHPYAVVCYFVSGMVLYIHSNTSYLSEQKARSQVGGHFFLSHTPTNPALPLTAMIPKNGAIHTVTNILKNVMSSATEATFAGLYHNARDDAMLCTTLAEIGHPQPATPIQTDNSTASSTTNGTVQQRKSKAMDMQIYWVQD